MPVPRSYFERDEFDSYGRQLLDIQFALMKKSRILLDWNDATVLYDFLNADDNFDVIQLACFRSGYYSFFVLHCWLRVKNNEFLGLNRNRLFHAMISLMRYDPISSVDGG